jgi:hypothetical protein
MVAPGDCSPSRKVVSKMMTRSCSDLDWVVMGAILEFAPVLGAYGRWWVPWLGTP